MFFTGLTMGLVDLIPGVSGGTIAFLSGIYEELLYSIKLVTGRVPKLVLEGKFKQAFRLIPFAFLLPLGAGVVIAIFGFVHLVSFLLEAYPVSVMASFFGLVLGSAYVVSKRISAWTLRLGLLVLLGAVLTYFIVGLPALSGSEAPLAVFATGAIAITAMILPGISGSLIMVILGQYEVMISAVAAQNIPTLATFAAGALAGLALFVRLLTWLMRRYHLGTVAFLIGVMIGSLREIWPWQAADMHGAAVNVLPAFDMMTPWLVALIVLGFVIVFMLERVGIAKEHDDIDTRDFKKEFKEIEG